MSMTSAKIKSKSRQQSWELPQDQRRNPKQAGFVRVYRPLDGQQIS